MSSTSVSAVLFAKDLTRVATFYSQALQMRCTTRDEQHWRLDCHGFELIVHQIPRHMADEIEISIPPIRREDGAIRLNFPLRDIDASRRVASSLGGQIDEAPPAWANPSDSVFLGYDPEGNVFKVSKAAEAMSARVGVRHDTAMTS
jgi:predicted enzyme related to lactoylglutathione lyase